MKILFVPMELPLPANSGGRIDVWRRLRMLKGAGHELALLSWHNLARDGAVAQAIWDELGATCRSHHVAWIRRTPGENIRRMAYLPRWPSHVAARWVTLRRPEALAWARAFAPDVLVLDGLYGVAAVRWLAAELAVPWVYRSHNVEHVYMGQQQARATGWASRLGLAANRIGLQRTENRAVRDAACVYDISPTDAEHWRRQGNARVHWLPAVVDDGFERELQAAARHAPAWDVVYFGNLNTPNNVEAVNWFVNRVLPLLPQPDLRVAVAGSRPSAQVLRLAARDVRITLLVDPPSVAAIAGAARLLVNPVQSGSGVNLKSVEMLFSAARLVSTRAGVQGLPADAQACFDVHDDAATFAQAITAALAAPSTSAPDAQRVAARAPYAPAAAAQWLGASLRRVVDGVPR